MSFNKLFSVTFTNTSAATSIKNEIILTEYMSVFFGDYQYIYAQLFDELSWAVTVRSHVCPTLIPALI